MSFAFGTGVHASSFSFGLGGFGVRGAHVASTGIDGPAYPYASLDLPADNDTEFMAWITTPPSAGVLVIDPKDFSFTWTDGGGGGLPLGSHWFGFTLVADGVPLSPERFVYLDVAVSGVLSGTAVLDQFEASGELVVDVSGLPLSDGEMRQLFNWVRDLHAIHGLAVGAPLTVGLSTRVAGHVSQSIAAVGGDTVVTRV